jgi:hypothetical protein
MSVIAATVEDITLVEGANSSIRDSSTGERKTYRVVLNFGTQTAGDTFAVVTANTKIANFLKNGKTITLRAAGAGQPGLTPGGTAAYVLDATISGTTLSGSVGGPTAAAAVASGALASVYVTVDES